MACNYNLHKQGVKRNTINHTNGKDCCCEQHQAKAQRRGKCYCKQCHEHKHKGRENVIASNAMNRSTNEKDYKMHNMTINNTTKKTLKQTKGKTVTNKISKVPLWNKT